jgi:hypothetical protein
MHGPNISLVLRSLDRLTEQLAATPAARLAKAPPSPGRVDLTDTEWVMYQTVADYNADDFSDAGKILSYLQTRLGYKRLKPGTRVTVNFRPHGSDVLLRPFDGKYAAVLSVDQKGRAWVQFHDADWTRAVQLGHAHSSATTGTSPYEATVYENIDPKKKAVRVDPLDIREYRTHLSQLGFPLPTATKRAVVDDDSSLVTPPNCPQCAQPMLYKKGRDGDDGYVCETCAAKQAAETAFDPDSDDSSDSESGDDGGDDESDGYFYDPLVRDLPDVSREQYLYVVKNLNDTGLGDWSPAEEHVLQATLGERMGTTLHQIDGLLTRMGAKGKPKTDDTVKPPSPQMKKKIKEDGPSDERGPKHLTKHGAKLWDEMFQIPHVKEYVQSATNPGHAWARAFSSFMAHSQHHHESKGKGAKFKPVMEGWDEARHKGWASEGGAMRAHKHGKRLAKIKEHFKSLAAGGAKLPTEVSKPGKPATKLPETVSGGESKWVRMIRKRDGKLVQVRRGKHTNKEKYAPVSDKNRAKYAPGAKKKAASVRTVTWAW